MMASIYDKWAAEDREAKTQAVISFAARALGWMARRLVAGILFGGGVWIGFALVGATVVCSR